MKAISFTVVYKGSEHTLNAFEPYAGATFLAHQKIGEDRWVVTHRGTTYIVHYPGDDTKAAAIAIADQLSRQVDAAKEVVQSVNGDIVGPVRRMKDEIVAILNSIGETPRPVA